MVGLALSTMSIIAPITTYIGSLDIIIQRVILGQTNNYAARISGIVTFLHIPPQGTRLDDPSMPKIAQTQYKEEQILLAGRTMLR